MSAESPLALRVGAEGLLDREPLVVEVRIASRSSTAIRNSASSSSLQSPLPALADRPHGIVFSAANRVDECRASVKSPPRR
jgi:hypothetical protein